MKKVSNKWITCDFGLSTVPPKFSKQENVSSVSPKRTSNPISLNFNLLEKLKPKFIDDLAVHSKKIKELQLWLESNVCVKQLPAPVLLLTGPTGSGKTSTLNVLCDEMGLQLVEWINPIDQDMDSPFFQGQAVRFIEFFSQSKYTSLVTDESNSSKRVVLVEDFPNFIIHNPTEFNGILDKCLSGGFPVIFICTEVSSGKLDLSQKLFPQELREKYNITNISFNPCSATLLKSALKRAQKILETQKDNFCIPDAKVVEAIISSTMGDIRCAINQYYFASLKGLETSLSISTTLNSSKGQKRKRNPTTSSIKSMLKDEKLGFFHGLGRVLNPKRLEINNSWRIQCDFNALIEEFYIQPITFNSFLQENYVNYFEDLGDVQKAADALSQAQIFLDNWDDRQDTVWYALWIAVLGLMVYNEHKVSKWNQIRAPKKTKLRSTQITDGNHVNQTDYLYYNIIRNNNVFPTFRV